MNVREAEAKLQNIFENKRLILDRTSIDTNSWSQLFEDVFPQPQVIIEDATITSSNNQVLVVGKSTVLGINQADIVLIVNEVSSQLTVSLSITVPEHWKLSQGFSGIEDTYFDDLEFTESILEISSSQDDGSEALQITATTILPDLESGEMELTIFPKAQLFSLTSPAPSDWDLPAIPFFSITDSRLTLKMTLPMQSLQGEVAATLTINERLAIPTHIELPASDEGWLFEANFEDVPIPNLSDITQLVGGDDLVNTLPAPLQEVGGFSFSDLQVMFNPETLALPYISLDIISTGEWPVIPGLLSVSNFLLSTKVKNPLDSDSRAITGQISGILKLASAEIEVRAYLPNFAFYGDLVPDTQIALREILAYFSVDSDEVPNVAISELSLLLESQTQACGFHIRIIDLWQMTLGQVDIELQDLIVDFDYAGGQATGSIRGSSLIADSELTLAAELGDHLVLSGSISYINLSALIQSLLGDIALPDELPEVTFSDIDISVTPTTGAFSLSGTTHIDWDFNTGRQKLNTQVDLTLRRTVSRAGSSTITCHIALNGEGLLSIADELILKTFNFNFNLEGNNDWSLSGDVTTTLFDIDFTLAASYTQTDTAKTFTLTTTSSTPTDLVAVPGVGGLSASRLALSMAKQSVPDQAKGRYIWNVSATGRVRVDNVFDFAGSLTLYQNADQTAGLNFVPTLATVTLPLLVPPHNGRQAAIHLDVGPISIVRKAATTDQRAAWAFEASVSLAFKNLPPEIQKLLPAQTNTRFKADTDAVLLTVDRLMNPIELPIPDIEIDSNTKIPLGTAALDASNLSIRFDSNIDLSAELGLGLPADLNNVFGVNADGSPAMDFFKVYDPADPDHTLVKLKLSVGTKGIKINPVSTPIEAIHFVQDGGATWCNCDFGEAFGAIRFKVPEFSLDTTTSSFMAKGGFETIRPLKLPLTPLKTLLTATDLKDVADVLPDSLPLKAISILDEQQNFRTDELMNLFQELGVTAPPEINQILTTIADRVNQLPDRFKHYLNIEIPDSFLFDIAITPDGGVRIDVRVKDGDPPIKLLAVGISAMIPVFTGIELRSFSFGEILGGSLFLMEVDARFDQFYLPTLASSLLLPQDGSLPLPASRELHRRLIIDKLFMIIVYQTGFPIPIPLFFEQLGIEYLGLEGIGLQSHVSFPMPKINLGEVGQLLSKIKPFFTQRDYLLDANNPPSDMDLTFSLGKNYIQLPQYLGHEVAGSQTELLKISAYQYTAKLLNGLKTLSLNDLVQALPLEYRVGYANISLGCLTADATWVLTTPGEFGALATQQLNIPSHEISNALAVFPPSDGTNQEQGLVTFLQGSWTVPSVATFEAMFGLVASGSMGFQTGFKIAGTIANFMDLELSGRVAINAPNPDGSRPTQAIAYALAFDGNDYVQTAASPSLAMAAVTIELWFKWNQSGSVVNFLVGQDMESLEIHLGGKSNSIRFIPTPQVYIDTLPNSFIPGQWVHLACVYDPAQSIGKIYVNGLDTKAVNHGSKGLDTPLSTSSSGLYLGTRSNQSLYFDGQMSNVRIWNRVRSETDIKADMQSRLNGHESGLVGYWALDEGTGTVAHDKTPQANHAALEGAQWMQIQSALALSSIPTGESTSPLTGSADAVFQLAGHSHLTLLGRDIFRGDVQIVDDSFQIKGQFDLFPENFPLTARGHLEGWLNESELYLAGDIETSLANITLVSARGMVTNDRITLQGTWLGVSTVLDAKNQDGALVLQGAVGLNLFGLRAAAAVTIDSRSGAVVQGTVDAIDLGIFKLTGADGHSQPSFNLQLQAGQVSRMDISGAVELLGLRSETQLSVSETSFSLHANGKIFNRFESSLEVTGGRIRDRNDVRVVATLQNDLFKYLKDEATKVITQAAAEATAKLTKAQQDVANAQQDVDKLNSDIAYWRGVVQQERAVAQNKVRELQQKVSDLQRPVDDLLNQIRYKESEWRRIDNDKHWVQVWPLPGAWLHKDPVALGRVGGEITGLYAAYGTATTPLEAAKASLRLAEGAVIQTAIDIDPRISPIFVRRDTATATLKVAQEALRILRDGVGAIAATSDFIAQMGANSVLEIRSARFEADLSQATGGQVSMDLDLTFMNEDRNIPLDFNFNDPISSSKALGESLLPG